MGGPSFMMGLFTTGDIVDTEKGPPLSMIYDAGAVSYHTYIFICRICQLQSFGGRPAAGGHRDRQVTPRETRGKTRRNGQMNGSRCEEVVPSRSGGTGSSDGPPDQTKVGARGRAPTTKTDYGHDSWCACQLHPTPAKLGWATATV